MPTGLTSAARDVSDVFPHATEHVDDLPRQFAVDAREAEIVESVRGLILTGAGTRAFCVGGDVKQRAETGNYGPTSNGLFEITYLHRLIRDVPKPVIAAFAEKRKPDFTAHQVKH